MCHGHGTGWILASARGWTRQGNLRRLGKSHFSHQQRIAGATVPWKSCFGKGSDPHEIPAIVFSPADLNIDPLKWRLSMDTSDFLHQSNHFYSFSSSRIMVDYRLCVVFCFFGQPGRTKIWFGTIPLHERWQPGHLFLANSSHHPINPSIYFMLFP